MRGGALRRVLAAEYHQNNKERAQRAHQADTSTQADGSGKPLSQAERMRRALGGSVARTTPLRISKVHRPAPLKISKVHMPAPELSASTGAWHSSRFSASKRLVSAKTAITAHLGEKERLQRELQEQLEEQETQETQETQEPQDQQEQPEQQAGTSTQKEDELRERLKKLEEQLAALQAKLTANDAAAAESKDAAGDMNSGIAEATASDSTPSEVPEAAGARQNNSRTAGERPARRRNRYSNSAADTGNDKPEEQPLGIPKQAEAEQSDAKTEIPPPAANTTLAQRIQAQSTSMKSSSHPRPSVSQSPPSQSAPQPSPASDELSEQSLLDELFPEASSLVPPNLSDKRRSPPKLDLPATDTNPHIRLYNSDTRTEREKAIDAFRARGEQTAVLQLSNCSTALTESDFRRLIPRGKHIDTWSSAGEFYKIIPGRDPLSLARLPFYYLLFHDAAAALAYQKNASRLSKLAALHAASSSTSAIAPPTGFLEDGEDIAAVTSSFVLHPRGHALDLRTVMQPYNRSLRALIDAGGYAPIVPNVDDKGRKIHRVLLAIDGYEPSHWDLWHIIARHAHGRGILWPWRNDHASALRRLRDAINLKTMSKQKFTDLASSNPRAASSFPVAKNNNVDEGDAEDREFEDPTIAAFLGPSSSSQASPSDSSAKEINQLVMNRVYNRWIAEFEDEDAARRFAGLWHRVRLPDAKERDGKWKEAEEERWVMAEYLW